MDTMDAQAQITASRRDGTLVLTISGVLNTRTTARLWKQTVDAVRGVAEPVVADCAGLSYMDGSGMALLLKLRDEAGGTDRFTITNLREDLDKLLRLTWDRQVASWTSSKEERRNVVEMVGLAAHGLFHNLHCVVAFTGEAVAGLGAALVHPGRVRWKDVLLSCIHVGADSLFIVALLGFLMGLIMSFQSAISLQRFGGEIFVPNMLGLVMFREMGPLVTAILLAARSGSAFAAEIGTMKINEELDALTTMGLSPVRFLVVPKMISSIVMVPLMTVFFNFSSLVGGATVMLSLDYPLVTFTSRVFSYLDYGDFWGGMAKVFVFSILVAGVGCLRGLQTRTGASAVGLSTTSAVVSGIVLIAVADGIFAVAYFYLGI